MVIWIDNSYNLAEIKEDWQSTLQLKQGGRRGGMEKLRLHILLGLYEIKIISKIRIS